MTEIRSFLAYLAILFGSMLLGLALAWAIPTAACAVGWGQCLPLE